MLKDIILFKDICSLKIIDYLIIPGKSNLS